MRKRFNYLSLVLLLMFLGTDIYAQEDKKSEEDKSKSGSSFNWDQKRAKRFRMDPIINTLLYDEFAPSISADGKTLVFQSNREGKVWDYYRLYEVKRDDMGKWSEPKPIDAINSKLEGSESGAAAGGGDAAAADGEKKKSAAKIVNGPWLSYDGKELYFSSNFEGNMDIYVSKKEGENWGAPTKVSGSVNTGDYEGFPSVSGDGKRLYFMRKAASSEGSANGASTEAAAAGGEEGGKKGGSAAERVTCYKLYVSKLAKDGTWGTAEEIASPINEGCEKGPRIAPDGETMYFNSMRAGANGDIKVDARDYNMFMSRLEEGGSKWSSPIPCDFANHLSADAFASVCPNDGPTTVMYFNVDMNASNDLYWTLVPPGFAPKKVMNVRGIVEDSLTAEPVYTELQITNVTRPSLSYDIYNDKESGKFSTVITEGNAYKVYIPESEEYMDYTFVWDYRSEESLTNAFQRCRLTRKGIEVTVKLIDGDTEAAVDGKITIAREDNTSVPTDEVQKKDKGVFWSRLKRAKYTINAEADGYEKATDNLDISSTPYGEKVEKIIKMYEEITVMFDNINFATARPRTMVKKELLSALDAKSRETLDKVYAFLKDYPKCNIKIESHTDDRGNDKYNQGLSERRAKAAYEYLISKGIPASRLASEGYGESKPTVPNSSPENLALNRRVEFKIVRNR